MEEVQGIVSDEVKAKKPIPLAIALIVGALMLALGLVGCAQEEPAVEEPAVELSQAASEYWQDRFPAQVASYLRTTEMTETAHAGSVPYQKLDEYPFMRAMYHGFGFWFDFRESRGHLFAVEDTMISGRPKFGGVCWACKSADYPALVAEYGETELNTMLWSEAADKTTHPVACIDCHDAESPDFELTLTRPWLEEAIVAQGKTLEDFDMRSLVCAQCHSEYYFEAPGVENRIVLPWSVGFTAEDALAHVDAEGFSDWTHPRTGAGVLKAQHPEFEFYQDSIHEQLGLQCADCHMPKARDAENNEYTSHWLTSPLLTVEPSCLGECHADGDAIITRTEDLQSEIRTEANAIGTDLETAINALRDARRNPEADQALIRQAQAQHRRAQTLLDWILVENSTGFHDGAEARETLAGARKATDEMARLTQASLQ